MLSENIKTLRKKSGYSQETLAQELNVVRQTVSKWEKGYSVPDAIMLERMAELFEVSASELLGNADNNEEDSTTLQLIADRLAVLNNQIARELNRKRKARKIALAVVIPLLLIIIIAVSANIHRFAVTPNDTAVKELYALDDGRYIMRSSGSGTDVPYLLIHEGRFNVIQNIAVSYQPSGNYYIRGNEVIMRSKFAGGDYIWVFKLIGNNTLQLQLSKSNIPQSDAKWEKDMIFVLAKD